MWLHIIPPVKLFLFLILWWMDKLLINLGILCVSLWWCIVLADASLFGDGLISTNVVDLSGVNISPPFDCANVTDVTSGECQSLVDLYVHTHGETWKRASNWLGSWDSTITTVCDWQGVRCDNGLYMLDLIENNLSWTIPTSFRNLSGFYSIYLWGNALTSIESGAFRSSHLRELNLFKNQLTGITDKTFSELDDLQELYLSYNHLSTLPSGSFSHLHTLTTLDISQNQLSTIEPNALVGLDSLRYFFLSNNQLTWISSTLFSGLSTLRELYLSYNQLNSIAPDAFSWLVNLEGLYLSNNWLNSIPLTISFSVQNIDLRYNCFSQSSFDSGTLSEEKYAIQHNPQSQSGCFITSWYTPPEVDILPPSNNIPQWWGWWISYSDSSLHNTGSSMDVKTMWLLLKKYIPNLPSKRRFERLLVRKPPLYNQIISFIKWRLR